MQRDDSRSLGGSSLSVEDTRSFDVQKESDVIALLKYLHQHPFESELKNHLRDLIFTYRQDLAATSHAVLLTDAAQLGIVVTPLVGSSADVQTQTARVRFNAGRPLPAFKKPELAASPATGAQKPTVDTVSQTRTIPVVSVTPAPTPTTPASATAAQQQSAQMPVSPIQTPTATAVQAPVTATPVTASTERSSGVNPQDRITEIKRIVHEKVGNPVQLIGTHNEIGRNYMNALLHAMKTANGAPHGELMSAMDALEKAFSAVLSISDTNVSSPVPVPETDAKQVSTAPMEVQNTSVAEAPLETQSQAKSTSQVTSGAPADTALEQRLAALKARLGVSAKGTAQTVSPNKNPQPVEAATAQEKVVQPAEEPTVTPAENTLRSVAKTKQLEDMMRGNREKEVAQQKAVEATAVAQMDPLFTPEVTAGLSQLLSEWTLFRSSGFFGTGPSGKDHELYQKLAPLQMASVVAGRFEGASPLIKQSLTDYMNGWRYEEGIIHEHGETFEHYLRKVVHHIITKKKNAGARA